MDMNRNPSSLDTTCGDMAEEDAERPDSATTSSCGSLRGADEEGGSSPFKDDDDLRSECENRVSNKNMDTDGFLRGAEEEGRSSLFMDDDPRRECENRVSSNIMDTDGGEGGELASSRAGGSSDSNTDPSESSDMATTEVRPRQEEGKAVVCIVIDVGSEIPAFSNSNNDGNKSNRHSETDSILKNTHGNDKDHRESSKKHVAWQKDCETEANSTGADMDCADQPSHCVNVGPGGQTDQPSPRTESPLSCRNKGLTDPENNSSAMKSVNVEGIKGKGVCLAAQGNNEIKDLTDTQTCPGDVCTPLQSTNTDRREGSETYPFPTLLARRRPVSANGVSRREGQCWGNKALSEESVRPFTAVGIRRLSLPLDINQRGSKENQQRLGTSEKVNKPSNSSELRLDAFVREAGKETEKATLVTYSEQEQVKDPGVEGNASTLKDKPRPSSSSPRARKKPHHRRPQTAGTVRPPRGGRPSTPRLIHSAPPRLAPPRPYEMKFTKEELQRALPRRHFFSCHNKALKDAGFEVEEENARPRRRRLLFFHHEEDSVKETPQPAAAAAPPAIREPQATTGEKQEAREDDPANVSLENTVETAVQMLSIHERAKRRKSHLPQVECKPLQLYLTYVAENPGEYRHMLAKSSTSGPAAALHPSSHPADNCHTARLVSMGLVFQEKHGGPKQRTDEVLRAAYSLNPRDADPYRFTKSQRDIKSPLVTGLVARKQSTLPNFQRKESAVSSQSGGGGGEDGSKSGQRSKPGSEMVQRHEEKPIPTENLTEMEKRRLKAEEWARTVTTDQLVRAKVHVLKELGHEEQELSQWWLAFRSCSYLRTRIRE